MGLGSRPLGKTAPQRRRVDAMPHKAQERNLGLDTRLLVLRADNEETTSPLSRIVARETPYSIGSTVVMLSIDWATVFPLGSRLVGPALVSPE